MVTKGFEGEKRALFCCGANYLHLYDDQLPNEGKKIIFCSDVGTDDIYNNGKFVTLNTLPPEKVEEIKKFVLKKFEKMNEDEKKRKKAEEEKKLIKLRHDQAEILIAQLRYVDAKIHCRIFNIDYKEILKRVIEKN